MTAVDAADLAPAASEGANDAAAAAKTETVPDAAASAPAAAAAPAPAPAQPSGPPKPKTWATLAPRTLRDGDPTSQPKPRASLVSCRRCQCRSSSAKPAAQPKAGAAAAASTTVPAPRPRSTSRTSSLIRSPRPPSARPSRHSVPSRTSRSSRLVRAPLLSSPASTVPARLRPRAASPWARTAGV